MTTTAARHVLYEHALQTWGAEPAQTLMDLLPQDPEHLATKDDVRVLGAELRAEMADLRTELRVEMHQGFATVTRTFVLAMVANSVALIGAAVAVAAVFAA